MAGGRRWKSRSRFAEEDFALADGEGDFGEGGDVMGGVGGEDDEVAVQAFGDVTGTGGVPEALGGIGGEGGENLLPGEAGAGHEGEFLGGVKVVGVADIGAKEDLSARVGVGLQLL